MKKISILLIAATLVAFVLSYFLSECDGLALASVGILAAGGSTLSGNPGKDGPGKADQTAATADRDTDFDGIASETRGREYADDDYYQKEIDEKIVKIRPMATPLDTISRYAKVRQSKSFEIKYYSVGTRSIMTTLTSAVSETANSNSTELPVADQSIFTVDDTIRVVGVKGMYDSIGTSYDSIYTVSSKKPDLILCVVGFSTSGNPLVYAVNGDKNSTTGKASVVPDIPQGTKLIRMGKACAEMDAQTGRFNNLPQPQVQFCQNFMTQVEQSTFDKIAAKDINWDFSDIEEDNIYDMKLAQENSYLFGVKNNITHPSKGSVTWFTGGIWWMAGKDIEVGTWSDTDNQTVVSEEQLVDICKELFVGTGVGNKRKVMLCGSEMLAALSKIKSEKFRMKESTEVWNLKFKSWNTDFGEILTIHDELFDLNNMSDCALALDPSYLTKGVHLAWHESALDLKKAGVRNTDARVIQEVSCLYLRYTNAHARMRLASA